MKTLPILFLALLLSNCDKDNHQRTLNKRVTEIIELPEFDNTPVIYPDSFRIKIYSNPYYEYNSYHPYQFLRDSAVTEDLLKLVEHQNPFVRTYAFASLAKREVNLFPFLVESLSDTTTFYTMEDDYGYAASPPDMMLQYLIRQLTSEQKDTLTNLIITQFNNLETTKEILLFIEPKPELYKNIRDIAINGHQGKFALVALSRYQNPDDLELIKEGFKMTDYYSGYKVFFMATEEFNHPTFKKDLINFKTSINKGFDNQGHDFYFNSLAKYRDPDCLEVIQEFIDVEEYRSEAYKFDNLHMIRRSLKKYYYPEYQPLIDQIEAEF